MRINKSKNTDFLLFCSMFEREVDIRNFGKFKLSDFGRFCERFDIPFQAGSALGTTFQENLSKNILY